MLTDLRLQNFRSYKDESFEFSPGVNIIVGPNASGKTNLLEAILMIARGGSYRVKDSELVRFNQEWLRLDCNLASGDKRSIKLSVSPKLEKIYLLDDKPYKRLGLIHSLPVVLFEPNHLQLLSGKPDGRREYLDDLLEQTTPGYGTLRRRYRRTLAQRNALLKQANSPTQTQLFPWNLRLSELAGQIVRARNQLIEQINKEAKPLYKALSNTKNHLSFNHQSAWPAVSYQSHFLKKLDINLETDRLRGFTTSGPHRDDLIVLFDGHPAQESASRGEARTAVLVLKIIELQILQTARDGQAPLLLLDDVFSELDGKRRHALTDYLVRYQTFITTTDADIVLKHFAEQCNVIPLS
jgi:DNA replication and repair protein RecF